MTLARLARTARYLKPAQVYGRALAKLPRPLPSGDPPPPVRGLRTPVIWPAHRSPSLLGPERIVLLNQAADIADASAWNDHRRAKLWLYNLHYFDDLNAQGWPERTAWHERLVNRWITENPAPNGEGWEPFPTSLRIVNWIKWFQRREQANPEWLQSLAVQLRWLERNIEWRLLGNHLFENAKSLVFGGLYFRGAEAEQWLRRGLSILERELDEQILPDGGHFERSPMYHALVLEGLLDLLNLGRASGGVPAVTLAAWADTASRMGAWLQAMSHPDGEIGFFNDAAMGIACSPGDLLAYGERLGAGPQARPHTPRLLCLKDSGYGRAEVGDMVALLDVAPIGPDYLPGHAHADTLSFELSLGRERLIVNGGTSGYGDGSERARERGTAAHSTVELNGLDSSEVWAGFRVGRRARVLHCDARRVDGGIEVDASHDGYRFLPGRPVHQRTWRFWPGRLLVLDRVTAGGHLAVSRLHLGPGVQAESAADGRSGTLTTAGGRTVRWTSSAPARVEDDRWGGAFGKPTPTRLLRFDFTREAAVELSW